MRPIFEIKTTKPRKSYFNVGERQKMKSRAELRGFYRLLSSDFERRYGLKVNKIELIDRERASGEIEINIIDNEQTLINKHIEIFKTKETTNLSDHSYLQFYYSGADFPSLFTIKKYKLRLNSLFETFNNPKGYYFDPQKKI